MGPNQRPGWQPTKIRQLGEVVTGNTPSTERSSFYGGKYPFITPSDLSFGSRTVQTERYLSEEGKNEVANRLLPARSVCFTSIGATIGKMCMTTEPSVTNQQINSIVVEENEHDPAFVYYLLRDNVDQIKALAGGAATPIVSKSKFMEAELVVPRLPTQRKIATILSAYDELIEDNTRRIAILEEMAQLLYREWFVHFRFPGYEHTEMVDSDVGSIPKNWKLVSAGDRFEVELGGTPARKEPECWENGDIPWIKSGKVNELRITSASEFITSLGLNSSSTEMMPRRTTVLAITGATLGQVSLLEIAACANQSVVGVYDQEGTYSEYLYLKFCEIIDSVVANASGSAQQHINKGIVSRTEFLIPDEPTIRAFNELIRPVFDLTTNLVWRNTALVRGRDLLLPRLVSGELDVGDLPIDVTLLEA